MGGLKIEMFTRNYIEKKQSKIIYGIAILLMVFHHMFGFPDRISSNWISLFYYKTIPIEVILGAFGRICIAIYSYISGYGLMIKYCRKNDKNIRQNYKDIFQRLIKFYCCYWMVFIIFVPIGILFFDYEFSSIEFLKNFIGLSCTYNAEWWYVWQYIRMLLLFPIVTMLIIWIDQLKIKKLIYMGLYIGAVIGIIYVTNKSFWLYLFCFIEGMMVAFYKLDGIILWFQNRIGKIANIIALVNILGVIFVRLFLYGTGILDFILAPVFIYGCLMVLDMEFIPKVVEKILALLGRYSVYIWLTHTFFIYYYFQKFVFTFHISFIIYGVLIIILVYIAMSLEKIQIEIERKAR